MAHIQRCLTDPLVSGQPRGQPEVAAHQAVVVHHAGGRGDSLSFGWVAVKELNLSYHILDI